MPIPAIHIEGYRGLKQLTIPKLAQVNLIVGKNGVGKSSLLEAIQLFLTEGEATFLRQSVAPVAPHQLREVGGYDWRQVWQDARHLFYGRPTLSSLAEQPAVLKINTAVSDALTITLGTLDNLNPNTPPNTPAKREPHLQIQTNGEATIFKLDNWLTNYHALSPTLLQNPVIHLAETKLDPTSSITHWDNIALTPLQDKVIAALNLLMPGISQLNFIEEATEYTRHNNTSRVPFVIYEGERVPLMSLGEGLTRMLSLALALANAAEGVLLVDEIGTGFHYTVQVNMWEFLMTLAHELNVQIFATTHSSDCVRAFQYVSKQLADVEGQMIRLEKWNDNMVAITLDEGLMDNALEYGIEVR